MRMHANWTVLVAYRENKEAEVLGEVGYGEGIFGK